PAPLDHRALPVLPHRLRQARPARLRGRGGTLRRRARRDTAHRRPLGVRRAGCPGSGGTCGLAVGRPTGTDLRRRGMVPPDGRRRPTDGRGVRPRPVPEGPMNTFAGTIDYYRKYRPGIPEQVADILDRAAPAQRPRRLLDVGTGTGLVVEALL